MTMRASLMSGARADCVPFDVAAPDNWHQFSHRHYPLHQKMALFIWKSKVCQLCCDHLLNVEFNPTPFLPATEAWHSAFTVMELTSVSALLT